MSCSPISIAASLDESLFHAIAFLTNPLRNHVQPVQINVLADSLRHNLAVRFSKHWNPAFPKAGSGTRCLSFSPMCDPPKPVLEACQAARIPWATWIQLLGAQEFDLVVDPGQVVVRVGAKQTFALWTKSEAVAAPTNNNTRDLVCDDDDSDLFALIDTVLRQPITPRVNSTWTMASPRQSTTPTSSHSRSSSSSGFSSASSASTCPTSVASSPAAQHKSEFQKYTPPMHTIPLVTAPAAKRATRAKQARVVVDSTKKAVTNYDGGKVGVLTGGTMLGGAARPRHAL